MLFDGLVVAYDLECPFEKNGWRFGYHKVDCCTSNFSF